MLYHSYEATRTLLQPLRVGARLSQFWSLQYQAVSSITPAARFIEMVPGTDIWSAGCQVIDDMTRRYNKPNWHIALEDNETGDSIPLITREVVREPFANLIRFEPEYAGGASRDALPKILLIAPLSGHYATLLRDTAETLVQSFDVYVTDWADGRMVPITAGGFDLNDYIDYLIAFIHKLHQPSHEAAQPTPVHVVAVCQPTVPALAATAYMAMHDDPAQPATLTLMAGPVDTRKNPTLVNEHADSHELDWFKKQTLSRVPFPNPGAMRKVYPGFMQLAGFMAMNIDRHSESYRDYFEHLAHGNGDDAQHHREFYNEYLSVMDLPAEFFVQTVDAVFKRHLLASGSFYHRGTKIDCSAIRNTALLTIEAGRDDICGVGQTEAAQAMCSSLKDDQRDHYLQDDVGHYGVFNGSRWREHIEPRIRKMILAND